MTNIYNLAAFELDPNFLQSRIKKELGCSVTVNEANVAAAAAATTGNDFLLAVQGNQIYPVSELLKSNKF